MEQHVLKWEVHTFVHAENFIGEHFVNILSHIKKKEKVYNYKQLKIFHA